MPKTTLPTRVHQAVPAPQLLKSAEQGYTCVPNSFFDRVAPGLKESELRVMLYLYRHTLGYHKLTDAISYEQFQHGIVSRKDGRRLDLGAGVCRRALVTALAALETKGLITRNHTTSKHAPTHYSVVIHRDNPHSVDNQVEEVQNDHLAGGDEVIEIPSEPPVEVQEMHSTIQTEHDNMKKPSRAATVISVEIISDQSSQSVQLMRENVPGLSEHDARRLADIALIQHGRDPAYIARLVEHVMSNQAIRVPAAVLTTLIQTNQERRITPPVSADHFRGATKMIVRDRPGPGPRPSLDMSKFLPGGKYAYLVAPSVSEWSSDGS